MAIFRCSVLLFVVAVLGPACPVNVTLGTNQSAATRNANTSALNSMFARVNSGELACHSIEFPEGVIEISGVIHVDGTAMSIGGVNRERSVIMQTAANQPVFSWNSGNRYVTGIYLHDLGFDNSNNRPPYNPAQWGLQFRCTADGTGGNSWGFANSQFERLSISHMYVGVGVYTQKNGVCGLWSTHFSDIKIDNSQRNAIYLVGGRIGQPANVFERIDVLQENSPPENEPARGDKVDAAAFFAVGANGLLINSLDIEGWNAGSAELEIYGGAGTVINNLRVEHAVFSGCNPTIGFFDADVVLNGTSISWDRFTNTCGAYVFSLAGSSASLLVNGVTLASTAGVPAKPLTMWRVDKPNPPAKIFANSLHLNGLASEWVASTDAGLTTTLYSRYAIDQMPPAVDKLPGAEALYLGRWFLCAGKVYRCVQNAAGGYEWAASP